MNEALGDVETTYALRVQSEVLSFINVFARRAARLGKQIEFVIRDLVDPSVDMLHAAVQKAKRSMRGSSTQVA